MDQSLWLDTDDRFFLLLLMPLLAASLPSLCFCVATGILRLHSVFAHGPLTFHLPPRNLRDVLFSIQSSLYPWIDRWNSLATLAATALFASTLLRARWRAWIGFALVPWSLLLCADFTLRWRAVFLP